MNEGFKSLTKSSGAVLLEKACDAVFPSKCLLCKRVVRNFMEILCGGCLRDFDAQDNAFYAAGLDFVYAACEYSEAARHVTFRFKYEGKRILARDMAGLVLRRFGVIGGDVLIPVPLHRKRMKERGFNQAELLAVELSRLMGMPAYDAMERTRDTRRQFELDVTKRAANVENAFGIREGFDAEGLDVVLVDDILTTGVTAGECAQVLRRAGAKSVGLIVFAAVVL